ncbi:uncharacterized protein TRIVIDRAFT_188797 [Trichoderma virens Gv29-8]|uniref:ABC transporter n=1 Tax=Hypocrea virens (strain Gv29-8 / FGSC 10586) TaxID=413071 RepID=G9MG60_HYPVG|nr:uncharacterized protein TRIVIDRAFT_188797 [Trichoderma virens Gv29-8]EHK26510.1 hypothetical protein TRIVIDRAFT_188797 [Trichoderma virens Gv29-8]
MPSSSVAARSHSLLITRFSIHTTLLVIECLAQHGTLNPRGQSEVPEECSNVLSRIFFFWVNPFLFQTFNNIAALKFAPALTRGMQPKTMRAAAIQTWVQRAQPEKRINLSLTLLKCVKKPFLVAIIPRLFLIGFKYSQPRLIRQCIFFVGADSSAKDTSYGYWIVVSAIVIYIGIAVSSGAYQHRLNKLKIMVRSILVGLIHEKAMCLPSVTYDDGAATTLMSTDVDYLNINIEIVHEIWAYLVELIIGVTLLAMEVGWIWPLPLLLILIFSRLGLYVTRDLHSAQTNWNQSTQDRVAATSSMIDSMKAIKMLGLKKRLSERIEKLRQRELELASKVRWMMVYYNACANSLGIFSPALTLVVFALLANAHGQPMDTATAFTTIAILSMIMQPANMVMTAVARITAALASLDRIQTFLLRPSLVDYRELTTNLSLNEKEGISSPQKLAKPAPAILIHGLTVGVFKHNVNLELDCGTFAIISGPVGSGKSTLLRVLLGEAPPVNGKIYLSTRHIAYCAQTPWVPSGTIRDIIQGTTKNKNEHWYHQVTEACCLSHDFSTLPDGDATQIGSRGLNLSGGLMRRVSLARAVFSRCKIALLDDAFSALDGDTERTVFNNLLGPNGLFRQMGTTVILAANSAQYFPMSDHVVILGNNGVSEQGRWQSLSTKAADIHKFVQESDPREPLTASNQLKIRQQTAETEIYKRTGDIALYGYYFRLSGLINVALLVGWTASYAFFISVPQYWLKLWTESEDGSTLYYISGFLFLCVCSLVSTHGTIWATVIRLAPNSGLQAHRRLLNIIMNAPLSFFSTVENGSILNRFSQDMEYVDQQLPMIMASVSHQIFKLFMQAALLFTAQKLLALSLPVCLFVVYIIQTIYLRTSRQLQLLELESRAAVFSSFLQSIEGLATIRAFGWQQATIRENVDNLHQSQRPEFLRLTLQRWLGIVLDLIAAAMAVLVISIVTKFRDHISAGQAGVALNVMLVANATLLNLVDGWTKLELALGAMARVKSLERSTPPEAQITEDDFKPEGNWPSKGAIIFHGATAAYHSGAVALQDVNLRIEAGQKVTIHGRTGSGKSSLILSLLRMLELQSGQIEIDGVDISNIQPEILRQRCFVTISQDVLLLSNETLRFNLDPEGFLSDSFIIEKLETVGLWSQLVSGSVERRGRCEDAEEWSAECGSTETAPSSLEPNILDIRIANLAELSVGQRQLLALCRALIKADSLRLTRIQPIILLDEATSSLDIEAEKKIHAIVDEEFTNKNHTVILVAHRLGDIQTHAKTSKEVVAFMADGRLTQVIEALVPDFLKKGSFQRMAKCSSRESLVS